MQLLCPPAARVNSPEAPRPLRPPWSSHSEHFVIYSKRRRREDGANPAQETKKRQAGWIQRPGSPRWAWAGREAVGKELQAADRARTSRTERGARGGVQKRALGYGPQAWPALGWSRNGSRVGTIFSLRIYFGFSEERGAGGNRFLGRRAGPGRMEVHRAQSGAGERVSRDLGS